MSDSAERPILNYAGPERTPEEPACWVNGPFLVYRLSAELPMRCIRCNCATERRVRKRLFWAPTQQNSAGGSLRLVPYVAIFFAFYSMWRWFMDLRGFRSPVVEVPLCERHQRISRLLTLGAWIAFPLSLTILFLQVDFFIHFIVPVIGFCISAILFSRPRPVRVVHVGIGHVTLSGIGRDFLASLFPPCIDARPTVDSIVSSTESLRAHFAAKKNRM